MRRFHLVILVVLVFAIGVGVGCDPNGKKSELENGKSAETPTTTPEKEADPLKAYAEVYVVVVPPTKDNPRCEIVTDPKVVAKDSKVKLTLVNLSGEALYVSFGEDIADISKGPIAMDGLENEDSWTVPLKTEKKGEYIYTVIGKGTIADPGKPPVTCLSHLPNPKIVIP